MNPQDKQRGLNVNQLLPSTPSGDICECRCHGYHEVRAAECTHCSDALLTAAAEQLRSRPRLDYFIDRHRTKPVVLLMEEESGMIVVEFPAGPSGLRDAMDLAKAWNESLTDSAPPAQQESEEK